MADLSAIRDALGDAVDSLGDAALRCSGAPAGSRPRPCVVIEPGECDWRTSMQRGHEKWDCSIRVLLGSTLNEAAHRERDQFFGGVRDLKDAIEGHVPLRDGTAAEDVFVARARKFDAWTYQGTTYLGRGDSGGGLRMTDDELDGPVADDQPLDDDTTPSVEQPKTRDLQGHRPAACPRGPPWRPLDLDPDAEQPASWSTSATSAPSRGRHQED